MNPTIPVSWGELIDKITILEIKAERLTSEAARANAKHELARLDAATAGIAEQRADIAELKGALAGINRTLWRIEDDIREKEAAQCFDAKFVELARAVYRTNDERGRIKKAIDVALKSEIREEKDYAAY